MPFLLGVAAITTVSIVKGADARQQRAERLEQPARAAQRDDDRHWHAGLLCVNRGDPAILVPKRFGVGWTINYGNPRTITGLAVGVAVLVVALVIAG